MGVLVVLGQFFVGVGVLLLGISAFFFATAYMAKK